MRLARSVALRMLWMVPPAAPNPWSGNTASSVCAAPLCRYGAVYLSESREGTLKPAAPKGSSAVLADLDGVSGNERPYIFQILEDIRSDRELGNLGGNVGDPRVEGGTTQGRGPY